LKRVNLEGVAVANHKSAKKRAKQTIIKNERNKSYNTRVRSLIKLTRSAVEQKDKENAQSLLLKVQSQLDKLVTKGVIKKNNASRRLSRLFARVSSI
jgi:small subunit ribosomal protein S20